MVLTKHATPLPGDLSGREYLDYIRERHPEAGDLSAIAFAKALQQAQLLRYGPNETAEIALTLCGVLGKRQPNRTERRTMRIRADQPAD